MGHGVSGRCGQVVLNSSDIVSLPFVLLYIKIFLSLLSKKTKKDAVHFTWLTYKKDALHFTWTPHGKNVTSDVITTLKSSLLNSRC